jgi:hypothetical protein
VRKLTAQGYTVVPRGTKRKKLDFFLSGKYFSFCFFLLNFIYDRLSILVKSISEL